MGSSGLADDGDGCAWVLQGWGYQVGGGVFVEVQAELLGGGHCWDTRLDRLMDIQVYRRCPGRRCRLAGPWCAKLASNVLWRAVRLGQQKGGSFEPPIVGGFGLSSVIST